MGLQCFDDAVHDLDIGRVHPILVILSCGGLSKGYELVECLLLIFEHHREGSRTNTL